MVRQLVSIILKALTLQGEAGGKVVSSTADYYSAGACVHITIGKTKYRIMVESEDV